MARAAFAAEIILTWYAAYSLEVYPPICLFAFVFMATTICK